MHLHKLVERLSSVCLTVGYLIAALCEDNSVRILRTDSNQYYGGDYPIEESYYIDDNLATGRIEVCHAGQWRAVCKDSWSGADTAVACNQLGFSRAGDMAINSVDGSYCTYLHACMHACTHGSYCTYLHACMPVHMVATVHICMHACLYTW